jgi:hypothetical protein
MNLLASVTEQDFTVDGDLPQGFLFASVKNTGSDTLQVNGSDLEPGEAKAYPFVGKGYPQIPFVVNGSTLKAMIII